MASSKIVTACLLIIGDEILSGRTQDANLAYIAKWLNGRKIQMAEVRVIPDDTDVIVSTLNDCRKKFDYIFTTGGIGPTHDDITAECVARAFNVPLDHNTDAEEALAALAGRANMTPARLRMARIPRGAALIKNPVSAAPGFQIENVFVMAGIPAVMRAMLDHLPVDLEGGSELLSRAIHVFSGESTLAATLSDVQGDHEGLQIGSYPFYDSKRYGANLVLRARDPEILDRAVQDLKVRLGKIDINSFDGEAP